jgi:hypothetical protein
MGPHIKSQNQAHYITVVLHYLRKEDLYLILTILTYTILLEFKLLNINADLIVPIVPNQF